MSPNDSDREKMEALRNTLPIDRRGVLSGIGAGAMAAGLGTGIAAADEHGESPPMAAVSGEDVHPVFGFAALSSEIDPPVAPITRSKRTLDPARTARSRSSSSSRPGSPSIPATQFGSRW